LLGEARVELPASESHVRFSIAATPDDTIGVDKIEFPVIHGIGDLGDASASRLMHAQATGFLFRDPANLFEAGDERRCGLR
jgi:hypothetical protein